VDQGGSHPQVVWAQPYLAGFLEGLRSAHVPTVPRCFGPDRDQGVEGVAGAPGRCNETQFRVVLPLDVAFEIRMVEVDVAQVTRAVALRLIVEVGGRWIAACAAGAHRFRMHFLAELNNGDEAVLPVVPYHFFVAGYGRALKAASEAPTGEVKPTERARSGVTECLIDIAGEALIAIDVAPWRLPGPEFGIEAGRTRLTAIAEASVPGRAW